MLIRLSTWILSLCGELTYALVFAHKFTIQPTDLQSVNVMW